MATQRSLVGRVGQVVNSVNQMFFGVSTPNQLISILGNAIDYEKEVGDVSSSDVAMACIHWAMRTFPESPLQMQEVSLDGDGEMSEDIVMDHDMLTLLEDPNPFYPSETLWSSTILSYFA